MYGKVLLSARHCTRHIPQEMRARELWDREVAAAADTAAALETADAAAAAEAAMLDEEWAARGEPALLSAEAAARQLQVRPPPAQQA